jgi:hypothetical protein
MMDGKEEIRSQRIGALNPFDESGPGGSECIEHERTTKARLKERSFDLLGEKKVELVLGNAARALRAWDVDSVPYIEGNTKILLVASCAVGVAGYCIDCFASFSWKALH